MSLFEIDVVATTDRVLRLEVDGEIDVSSAPGLLDSVLCAALASDHRQVVMDLRNVRFIDSSGLGAIIEADRRLRHEGAHLVIVRPTGLVQRLFEMTGLDGSLDVRPDHRGRATRASAPGRARRRCAAARRGQRERPVGVLAEPRGQRREPDRLERFPERVVVEAAGRGGIADHFAQGADRQVRLLGQEEYAAVAWQADLARTEGPDTRDGAEQRALARAGRAADQRGIAGRKSSVAPSTSGPPAGRFRSTRSSASASPAPAAVARRRSPRRRASARGLARSPPGAGRRNATARCRCRR